MICCFILSYYLFYCWLHRNVQNQSFIGVLIKRCSENMQQICWRTPMPKCDFNKVQRNFIEITLRHGYSPVNLLHIFRTVMDSCRDVSNVRNCSASQVQNFADRRSVQNWLWMNCTKLADLLRSFNMNTPIFALSQL